MGTGINKREHSRSDFFKRVGAGAALLAASKGASAFDEGRNEPKKLPNIVLIMADDMGYGDVGCYNPNSLIPTPHMNRLADQGIRFTDAHSPSSVCTPTRYGLLTGRYCWRSRLKWGVFGGYDPALIEKGRLTLPLLLKRYGYGTACVGKWHLGQNWITKDGTVAQGEQDQLKVDFSQPIAEGPTTKGFDYFFGTSGCPTDDPPFCFIENDRAVGVPDTVALPHPREKDRIRLMVRDWKHDEVDTTFCRKAVFAIENHVRTKPNAPFLLYLPLSVPHIPWLPPDFVKGKSQAGPRGDQVVLADWIVGQVMSTLSRVGLEDNSLVIVTSDNGPRQGVNGHKSAGDWRGLKASVWEGGHRVPFIARWPGRIKPGTVSDQLFCLTDLMATSAAIVGVELPEDAGEDSYNILPALLVEKADRPIRESIVHHGFAGTFAIRQGTWKLILGTKGDGAWAPPEPDSPGQLYNLAEDPGERHDLWDEHPETVARLTDLLEQYRRQGHSQPSPV